MRRVRRNVLRSNAGSSNAYFSLGEFPNGYLGYFVLRLGLRTVRLGGLIMLFYRKVLELLRGASRYFFVREVRNCRSQGSSSGLQSRAGFGGILQRGLLRGFTRVTIFLLKGLYSRAGKFNVLSYLSSLLRSIGDAATGRRSIYDVSLSGFLVEVLSSSLEECTYGNSFRGFRGYLLCTLAKRVSNSKNVLKFSYSLVSLVSVSSSMLNALGVVVNYLGSLRGGILGVLTGVAYLYRDDNVYSNGEGVRRSYRYLYGGYLAKANQAGRRSVALLRLRIRIS